MELRVLPDIETQGDSGEKSPMWPHDRWHGRDCTRHEGFPEAGATLEMRVKKADGKGTSFADLVWKPVVLIEMKRRGEDLTRHYRQAFDHWTRLVPGRPRCRGKNLGWMS